MILDTSPLVAILAKEPDFELYVNAISHASRCRISVIFVSKIFWPSTPERSAFR